MMMKRRRKQQHYDCYYYHHHYHITDLMLNVCGDDVVVVNFDYYCVFGGVGWKKWKQIWYWKRKSLKCHHNLIAVVAVVVDVSHYLNVNDVVAVDQNDDVVAAAVVGADFVAVDVVDDYDNLDLVYQ